MKTKIILSVLLVLCFVLAWGPLTASAEEVDSGTCGENLTWTLTDDGTMTISGTGAMDNYESASDAPWYTNRTSVTAIVIEDGVTTIGARAFYNCVALADVTIGSNVTTIGTYAFRGCSVLAEVTIPANVTVLETSAFRACSALSMVIFEGEAPQLGSYVFNDCTASLVLGHYEGTIGYDVTPWTDYTLKALHVGQWMVDAEATCTTDGSRHIDCSYCGKTITEVVPGGHTYADGYCVTCDKIQSLSYTIRRDGTVKIKQYTGPLAHLEIPATIEGYPVTEIGSAFRDLRTIVSVTIPESVTAIDSGAFQDCSGLTTVVIHGNIPVLKQFIFAGCTSLVNITIPDSVTEIEKYAFCECTSLTDIVIPEGVTKIGENAFESCYALASVSIPKSLTRIENNAFFSCRSVTDIYISDFEAWMNLITKGDYANPLSVGFREKNIYLNGELLTEAVIPESISQVKDLRFEWCTSLTSVTISESVTSIGKRAFYNCSNLAEITFLGSVTSIGKEAFYGCSGVSTIYFRGDAPVSDGFLFTGITATAYYPAGNDTWTQEVMASYGGKITWIPVCAGRHNLGEWYTVTEATCSQQGEERRDCVNCQYYESKFTDLSDHSYESVVTAPTCTDDGCTVFTCTVCGHSQTQVVGATGHSYVEIVIAPTCTEQGFTTHTCTECGDSYVDSYTDALGHDYDSVITAPTCTEEGYTTHTCHCGESYVDSFTEAPGHRYEDGYCTACGKSEIALGDVNGDGEIDTTDAYFIVMYYNEMMDLTEEQLLAADVNGDGEVDTTDAYYIVMFYNEMIDAFPAEED